VQDYYELNPLFLKPGASPKNWGPIKAFIRAARDNGMDVIMDLVINHTAIDSVLVAQHPKWYRRDKNGKVASPYCVDTEDSSKVTVWGDLGEINNARSSDKKALWAYWDELIAYFQNMGIYGFRCDAAYKVPAPLWKFLIGAAKARYPQSVFLAETLGCTPEQTVALKGTGFDYLFNSSKYWNYDRSWCIDQHEEYRSLAPSISFAESHDTPRLAGEQPGHVDMQKSRYVVSAIFSRGVLMTMGYEYGARTRMDVVRGTPRDAENPQWDISGWIGQVNGMKMSVPVLQEEGHWKALTTYDAPTLFLEKRSDTSADRVIVLVNKDWSNRQSVDPSEWPEQLKTCTWMIRACADPSARQGVPGQIELGPTEIVLFGV
jgi:starch synthase (maltosyl-transferring)